jgi:RNA polymerase sigma factor (sigma-70 family)
MAEAMPMVDRLARRMARRHPALSFEAYQSLGYEALWRAALKFEPTREVKLISYAWPRCWGAMRDGAREHQAQDPLRRACQILGIEALSSFEASDDAFADTDESTLNGLLKHCGVGSLEMATVAGCATWREQGEDGVLGHVERLRVSQELKAARGALDGDESAVVALHFDDALPWGAVAETLGFSESTAKRLAAVVREKLRRELLERGVDEAPQLEQR